MKLKKGSLLNYLNASFNVIIISLILVSGTVFYFFFKSLNDRLVSEKREIVSNLLIDSVREPLLQGSYLEVQQRIMSAVKKNVILCADIEYPFKYLGCTSSERKKGVKLNKVLNFENSNELVMKVEFYYEPREMIVGDLSLLVLLVLVWILTSLVVYMILRSLNKKLTEDFESLFQLISNDQIDRSFNFAEYNDVGHTLKRLSIENKENEKHKATLNLARQVAHDIRAPLDVIEFVSSEFEFSEQENELKNLLSIALERMRNISSKLLDSTKVKKIELNHLFSIRAEILNVIEEKKIMNKNDVLEFHFFDEVEDFYVMANRLDFQSVISNLVDNAIQAKATSIEFTVKLDDSYRILVLKDNGFGIAEDLKPYLFKDGFTYGKEFGNGFGLSYAKAWITQIGGMLEFTSELRKGTSFILKFPKH